VELNANSILVSLLIGLVGLACFRYGRRQGRVPPMIAGVVLIVYPYFVSNVGVMLAIAAAILAALWGAVQLGW
jgi:hypothetical protein